MEAVKMKKVAIVAKSKVVEGEGDKAKTVIKEFPGECTQYDSVAEAIATVGDKEVLSLINELTKTKALNALRVASSTGPTTVIGKLKGLQKTDPEKFAKIEALLKSKGLM